MKSRFTLIALIFVCALGTFKIQAQTEADSCLLNAYAINYSTTGKSDKIDPFVPV